MIVFLHICSALILLIIFYQDYKERWVYGWLFIALGICLGTLHYLKIGGLNFVLHALMNEISISVLLVVLLIYIKLKYRVLRFDGFLGLGDIFMFYSLGLAFAPFSFLILFVCGLICSLLIHKIIENSVNLNFHKNLENQNLMTTVPLAGYLGLFFLFALLIDISVTSINLYAL